MEAPVVTIRSLLVGNWDSTKTSNSTPNVHTGWYSSTSKKSQVSITDPDEDEMSGSPVGYSGIGGNNPNSEYAGLIYTNIWITRPQAKEFSNETNPKQLSHEYKEEIDRIIRNNAGNPGGDLNIIGLVSMNRRVEPEREPTVYRVEIVLGYTYSK